MRTVLFWAAWAVVAFLLIRAAWRQAVAADREQAERAWQGVRREMRVSDGGAHEAPGRLASDAGARTYAAKSNTARAPHNRRGAR